MTSLMDCRDVVLRCVQSGGLRDATSLELVWGAVKQLWGQYAHHFSSPFDVLQMVVAVAQRTLAASSRVGATGATGGASVGASGGEQWVVLFTRRLCWEDGARTFTALLCSLESNEKGGTQDIQKQRILCGLWRVAVAARWRLISACSTEERRRDFTSSRCLEEEGKERPVHVPAMLRELVTLCQSGGVNGWNGCDEELSEQRLTTMLSCATLLVSDMAKLVPRIPFDDHLPSPCESEDANSRYTNDSAVLGWMVECAAEALQQLQTQTCPSAAVTSALKALQHHLSRWLFTSLCAAPGMRLSEEDHAVVQQLLPPLTRPTSMSGGHHAPRRPSYAEAAVWTTATSRLDAAHVAVNRDGFRHGVPVGRVDDTPLSGPRSFLGLSSSACRLGVLWTCLLEVIAVEIRALTQVCRFTKERVLLPLVRSTSMHSVRSGGHSVAIGGGGFGPGQGGGDGGGERGADIHHDGNHHTAEDTLDGWHISLQCSIAVAGAAAANCLRSQDETARQLEMLHDAWKKAAADIAALPPTITSSVEDSLRTFEMSLLMVSRPFRWGAASRPAEGTSKEYSEVCAAVTARDASRASVALEMWFQRLTAGGGARRWESRVVAVIPQYAAVEALRAATQNDVALMTTTFAAAITSLPLLNTALIVRLGVPLLRYCVATKAAPVSPPLCPVVSAACSIVACAVTAAHCSAGNVADAREWMWAPALFSLCNALPHSCCRMAPLQSCRAAIGLVASHCVVGPLSWPKHAPRCSLCPPSTVAPSETTNTNHSRKCFVDVETVARFSQFDEYEVSASSSEGNTPLPPPPDAVLVVASDQCDLPDGSQSGHLSPVCFSHVSIAMDDVPSCPQDDDGTATVDQRSAAPPSTRTATVTLRLVVTHVAPFLLHQGSRPLPEDHQGAMTLPYGEGPANCSSVPPATPLRYTQSFVEVVERRVVEDIFAKWSGVMLSNRDALNSEAAAPTARCERRAWKRDWWQKRFAMEDQVRHTGELLESLLPLRVKAALVPPCIVASDLGGDGGDGASLGTPLISNPLRAGFHLLGRTIAVRCRFSSCWSSLVEHCCECVSAVDTDSSERETQNDFTRLRATAAHQMAETMWQVCTIPTVANWAFFALHQQPTTAGDSVAVRMDLQQLCIDAATRRLHAFVRGLVVDSTKCHLVLVPTSVETWASRAVDEILDAVTAAPLSLSMPTNCMSRCTLNVHLSNAVDPLPWEATPLFSRLVTIRCTAPFTALARPQLSIAGDSFFDRTSRPPETLAYLVNPTGDLTDTESRFVAMLGELRPASSRGIVGAAEWDAHLQRFQALRRDTTSAGLPLPDNVLKALLAASVWAAPDGDGAADVLLYMGHGGAERFMPRDVLRCLERDALHGHCGREVSAGRCLPRTCLLMGCSSGAVVVSPSLHHNVSTTAAWLHSGHCRDVVSCMWHITDADIDRLTHTLLEGLVTPTKGEGETSCPTRGDATTTRRFKENASNLLATCLFHARSSCKLKYLTGCATVATTRDVAAIRLPQHPTSNADPHINHDMVWHEEGRNTT